MALPSDISGLYQNVRTVNGITVGGSVAQILQANGSLNWINRCYSLVSNNNYGFDITSVTKENANGSELIEWQNKGEIMRSVHYLNGTNTGLMLTLGSAVQTYPGNSNSWYGEYNSHSEYGTSSSTGTAYTGFTDIYPIISTVEKEHYIGVVQNINARDLEGNTWSGHLHSYREVVSQYPYVISASILYYYKPDLNSTNMTALNIGFLSYPKSIFRDYWITGGSYRIVYSGFINTSLGSTLLSAPALSSRIRSDLTHSWWETSVTPSLTPFAPLAVYSGNISNNIAPFAYYTLDDIIKAANSRGLWWAESFNDARNEAKGENTTSNYVHAPYVNTNGSITDEDSSGSDIYTNWYTTGNENLGGGDIITGGKNSSAKEDKTNQYEKLEQVTNNEQNNNLEPGSSSFTGVGCFATYYAMTPTQIENFNDELWSSDEEWYNALISGLKLWGADPMQAVMSLRLYPFNVGELISYTNSTPIKFGRVEMQSTGFKIKSNSTILLDLGETWINEQNLGLHGDFRDYSPYTEVTLYIPFVGLTQINVNDFMNTAMRIKMTVDITTGSCCAVVYADNAPYLYLPGTIGVEIPITLNTMTEVAVGILQSTIGLAAGAIGGVAGYAIATGGSSYSKYAGITNSDQLSRMHAAEEEVLASNIEHTSTPILTDIGNTAAEIMFGKTSMDRTGNSSPAAALTQPLYCYLIVSTPTWERPDNYDHTYGKICHESGQLRSYTGFTICRNVDASGIICTKVEQEMIQNYLESGVYL